jgi:branched-chain amino acid transport system substrate-binding protein
LKNLHQFLEIPKGLGRRTSVVLLATGLALAGVSAVSASAAVKKVKLSTYNIGIVTSSTGGAATTLSPVVPTVIAWVDSVNAAGGIDHHKVKLFQATDSDDPSALTAVQNLITQDHIIALVDNSAEDAAFEDYVNSERIPVVTTTFNGHLVGVDKYWYPFGSPTSNIGVNTLTTIEKAGKTKVAVLYCAEYASCNVIDQIFDPYLSETGTSLVYVASISATAPTYTAQCLAAQQAGATSLVIFEPGQIGQKVVDDCDAQGYDPLFVATTALEIPAWLQDPNLNGAELYSPDIPDFVSNTPATKAEFAALGKYSPTVLTSQYFSEEVPNAWVDGKMLQLAMVNGDLGNKPTKAKMLRGFATFKNETFGGMSPPLTVAKSGPVIPACVFTETISNGTFVLNNGLNLTCPPHS